MQTITSSQSPSVVYVATTVPVQTQATQSNNDSSSSSNIGAIVGGVVGGFFGLLGIALVIWFVMKRRRRWDDIFDKEDADIAPPRRQRTDRFSLDADVRVEPKPYQYGLVGQSPSPGAGISPPNSPPSFGVTSLPRQHTLTPSNSPHPRLPRGPASQRSLRDPPPPGRCDPSAPTCPHPRRRSRTRTRRAAAVARACTSLRCRRTGATTARARAQGRSTLTAPAHRRASASTSRRDACSSPTPRTVSARSRRQRRP
ncbi:hypothetical protein B0H10DRAFT_863196 [Mycena sp. CBHHK59/15]|nr:hypothetical protein B0H10DRAFT_863196 [Mycena sp. CBHHK59/15]